MNYREYIEKVLDECTRRGEAYAKAIGVQGNTTTYLAALKSEIEKAEDEYEAVLDLIMQKRVELNDPVVQPGIPALCS